MSVKPMTPAAFDRWYKREYGFLYGPHYQWMREGMVGERAPAERDGCVSEPRKRKVPRRPLDTQTSATRSKPQ